jgi:hypothetical protein
MWRCVASGVLNSGQLAWCTDVLEYLHAQKVTSDNIHSQLQAVLALPAPLLKPGSAGSAGAGSESGGGERLRTPKARTQRKRLQRVLKYIVGY